METTTLILTHNQKNFLNKMLTMAYKEVRMQLKSDPKNAELNNYEELVVSLLEELNGDSNV